MMRIETSSARSSHRAAPRPTRGGDSAATSTVPAASGTVVVSLVAANRDGQHWTDPEVLDVTRTRVPHLAFGHGVHQCLGQQLARVEMAVGYTELLRRLPNLRLAVPPEEVPLRNDMFIYGVHALPVTWDAP